jgi:hypothetical protein
MEPENSDRVEMEETRAHLALKTEQPVSDLLQHYRVLAVPLEVEYFGGKALSGRQLKGVIDF